jgi:transposase
MLTSIPSGHLSLRLGVDRCRPNLEGVESVLADGGYTGQPFADGVKERLQATAQVVKRNQLHTFACCSILFYELRSKNLLVLVQIFAPEPAVELPGR